MEVRGRGWESPAYAFLPIAEGVGDGVGVVVGHCFFEGGGMEGGIEVSMVGYLELSGFVSWN